MSFFLPSPHIKKDDQRDYVEFTDDLARKSHKDMGPADNSSQQIASMFGNQIKLYDTDPKTKSAKPIHSHIPLWRKDEIDKHIDFTKKLIKDDPDFHAPKKDGIVEFEYLSHCLFTLWD